MLAVAGGIILAVVILFNLPLLMFLAMVVVGLIVGLAVLAIIPLMVANYSETAALWTFVAEVLVVIAAWKLMGFSDARHKREMDEQRAAKFGR